MPSSDDFTQAAAMFSAASAEVDDLVMRIDQLDTTEILIGGTLGRDIPDGLIESAERGRMCRRLLDRAAEICRERALEMADYEAALEVYNSELAEYNAAWAEWDYKIANGGDPAHPAVAHPYPVTAPSWSDDLGSSGGPVGNGLVFSGASPR